MTHEGWKNYETWCIALWIHNDQPLYNYWRDVVSRYSPVDDGRVYSLADSLKAWFEEKRPPVQGCWADLLSAALSEVDWAEIAGDLLSE